MWLGWTAALIGGIGLYSYVFLIGDIFDSFKQTTKVEDTIKIISRISLVLTLVGFVSWVFSYLAYSCLLLFSDRVTKKIKVKYLKAILNQESSWFDTINPSDLSARLSKEAAAIH
jgi:ATP-binding cassette subfamily B (MDR/TAP) protein 1